MNAPLALLAHRFARLRLHGVFVLAVAAGLALLASGQSVPLDQGLKAVRETARRHPASGEVQIVEIDARSLQAIARWPWPRSIHAAVIDRLVAAGVRSIAFDVDLSATSTPVEDGKLAAALDRADGIVSLPTFRQQAGGGNSGFVDSLPAPIFRDHAFVSAVNVLPDGDGTVREMPLAVETGGIARPSLATLVAESRAETGLGFPIDYSIDPASIPRHSVIDLIQGRVPAAELAGKRIIVGATAIEMGDRYTVPHYGVIPGVVVQALAAETLLAGPIPRVFPGWPLLALTLVLILVALRARRRRTRLIVFAATGALVIGLPLASESALALTVPSAAALAALLTALAGCAAALALERYLEKAFADDATLLPNLEALAAAAAAAAAPASALVLARIHRFAGIAAGLTPEATATLIRRVAERLAMAGADGPIYRVDAAELAWVEPIELGETLVDRLEGVAALMRAPVECGRLVDVALNFGVAPLEGDPKQAVANAALAAAEAEEQNMLVRHFGAIDTGAIEWQLTLLGELDQAMEQGDLWNAYQPKLDLRTGRIVSAEALVRWTHPHRGPIRPDQFIPVLEKAGRVRDLTLHVLEQALDDALAWDRNGYPIGVAVNVSAGLLADHGFIERVAQMLASHALPDGRITIEVTETATMAAPEQAVNALNSWRAMGVHVSIDDYGTGQSSLGYLQRLPADELKIDMSFVRTIATDQRNSIMVRSTIALAHELGLKVVAEGVEDEICLEALRAMGCDIAQGYHIGRPADADSLLAALGEDRRQAA